MTTPIKNYVNLEGFELEAILKITISTLLSWAEISSIRSNCWKPQKSGLEHFHGGGTQHSSEQLAPISHHSHRKQLQMSQPVLTGEMLVVFMTFLWSTSFLFWRPQNWTQYSRWRLGFEAERSFDLLATLLSPSGLPLPLSAECCSSVEQSQSYWIHLFDINKSI